MIEVSRNGRKTIKQNIKNRFFSNDKIGYKFIDYLLFSSIVFIFV